MKPKLRVFSDNQRYGDEISEEDIINFEEQINHKLPNDYRKFLLEYNGGYVGANYVFGDV